MSGALRRCGMCQQMKSDGIVSDDGTVFICSRCNEKAAKFLEISGSLGIPPHGPEAT